MGACSGKPEYGEDLVADIFFDSAATIENPGRHALVEVAQHGYHPLGRQGFGHASETHDIDEQNGYSLAPHRTERLVAVGQQIDYVGRKIACKVGACPLSCSSLLIELPNISNGFQRLVDRDLKVVQINRLGDEVEGTAVHSRADVGHVSVSRYDHCARRG